MIYRSWLALVQANNPVKIWGRHSRNNKLYEEHQTTSSGAGGSGFAGVCRAARFGLERDGDSPAGLEPYQKVGARYYDRLTGRFITRDTDLSQSPYAYCDGDPVNCSDPSGHAKKKKNPLQVALVVLGALLGSLTGNPTGMEEQTTVSQPASGGGSKGSSGAGGGGSGGGKGNGSTFSNLAKAGGLALLGYGLYEGVKWGAGIFFAPETAGGSLLLAAATP